MFEIRRVDPADEALLRALWEIGAAGTADAPAHDFSGWKAARWRWSQPTQEEQRTLWAGYDGEGPIGYAEVALPLLDNPRLAEVFVAVTASARRRGHGTALLETAIESIRGAGRSIVFTGVSAGPDGVPGGQAFAERHGFALAQFDVEKALDVAAHSGRWRGMLDEMAPHSTDYDVVTWTGVVPEEHADAVCLLLGSFIGEIPLGDLEIEDERWDRDRLRRRERFFAATDRESCLTLALAPDGSPAGYTEVVADGGWPGIGFQEGTLVLPAHRGHRLGLRIKLANQLRMAHDFPGVHTVETGNAGENAHMSAVNERLGFRPVGRWLEMQRRL